MRIAVDARAAANPARTGIGVYTWEMLRRLPRVDPGSTYIAWYLNAQALIGGPRRTFEAIDSPKLAERWTPIPARLFEPLSRRLGVPRIEWFVSFDVLFAPNFQPPPTRARRLVVTVHDLAFRRHPETAPISTRRWLTALERTIGQATRVIVPSEATKSDLAELYGVPEERVAVIAHGVDAGRFQAVTPEDVAAVRTRFGVDGPYLLYLGGIEPRKNLPNLLRAFARTPLDLRVTLVIAGSGTTRNPEGTSLLANALDSLDPSVRRSVILTGYVSEPDKAALLSGAEALVYPSLYEGFGLPVLEAMAAGTPVLTSDVSALPEVGGQGALYVDPRRVASIADGLQRILTDRSLRGRLRELGLARASQFTWERTAERTADVLHDALAL